MSTDLTNFEEQIEQVYQQYRHRQLASRLNDIADTMEETILQRVLAEKFLDKKVKVDEEAKEAVSEARDLLNKGDLEPLSERLDTLEDIVNEQDRYVTNEIQETRVAMRKRIAGMRRINDRVEMVPDEKLQAVHELLADWDWKDQVYRGDTSDIETLKNRSADYGSDMRRSFEECREAIFGPYSDTVLESVVEGLSTEKRLSFDDLSEEQLTQLRDSDLVEHVELSLS